MTVEQLIAQAKEKYVELAPNELREIIGDAFSDGAKWAMSYHEQSYFHDSGYISNKVWAEQALRAINALNKEFFNQSNKL